MPNCRPCSFAVGRAAQVAQRNDLIKELTIGVALSSDWISGPMDSLFITAKLWLPYLRSSHAW
jgi:hypothetical protein